MLESFGQATQTWFERTFVQPTAVQEQGWAPIVAGKHSLLLAPTGSGKTLAAFLASIDRLSREATAEPGIRVLYISPLKALVYDIERNLRAPLVGIRHAADSLGLPIHPITVDVRTGDTPQKERQRQKKRPGDILVTTPESLYLLLTSQGREALRHVQTVIIDEIHTMAGTKRGAHLALTLERLAHLTDGDPQRIGLSATQRPLELIASYLGGNRPVDIIDASAAPAVDLQIVVPVPDMEAPVVPDPGTSGDGERQPQRPKRSGPIQLGAKPEKKKGPEVVQRGIWPAIYPRLLALIRAHRSTIVFTNSRLLCERLAQRLNEMAGEELVRAHHGSISHARRTEVEEALKQGRLPGIIATSSLELGIDMGAVDLVVMVESPGSVARGLQRVGRAGHQVGQTSIGRLFPKFRGDLLEATVVTMHMLQGRIEETKVPRNCLDVLAQHIVAMVALDDWHLDVLEGVIRQAFPFRELSRDLLASVLDMLAGRYPSDEFSDLAPRLNWDRATDQLTARRGARMLAVLNPGTIPDRGLYTVYLAGEGPRLGELDEEMVYETRRGDNIILGASTWKVEEITRDRVVVVPAPGEPGRLPFWKGERPGRPIELGRAIGAFLAEIGGKNRKAARAWLQKNTPLDALAAGNLVNYIAEQKDATGTLPTDKSITVEQFRDELGDWRVCVLSPFGAQVHAPWALALEQQLAEHGPWDVQVIWSDDGIAIRFADVDELPPLEVLFPDPEDVEDRIVEQLGHSALFAARFRENAARALLMPKRNPKGRQPLWARRLKAQNLMAVASRYPSFPIILETYRECLQDVFDVPSLVQLLTDIRSRDVKVQEVETPSASPFARSLVFQFVAAYLYDGDAPLAERKAQALALDRNLLRELLGDEQLRELLEPVAVDEVEAELQWLTDIRLAHHADAVHDLLRRLGDLSAREVAARSAEDPSAWLEALVHARRAVPVRIGGEARYIAVEDAARYRDGLGVALPTGLPQVFLDPAEQPLESLLMRWARTHGPFLAQQISDRWGLLPANVEALLVGLEARDLLLRGDLRPGGTQREWCDPDVLRRLRRRSLAKLRKQVAPVEADVYTRFVQGWHGLHGKKGGPRRLSEAIDQLEGLAMPFSVLESEILPARVAGFKPDLLDQLGATGEIVWIGRGALGPKDGKVALYKRHRVPLLLEAPEPDVEGLPRTLLDHLIQRGACFLVELHHAAPDATAAEVQTALWDLVWAGLITNDTVQPLRNLRSRSRKSRARSGQPSGGRWSAVAHLLGPERPATERAHARVVTLLERYGVVSREAAIAEEISGGFTSIYPILRAMEEAGRVRRGYFVDGFSGAQFAMPGAVDRLRSHRKPVDDLVVLSAVDPANPWGSLLTWPSTGDGPRPRRVPGARVVLAGGLPAVFRDKGRKSLLTFAPARENPDLLRAAVAALTEPGSYRTVRIDKIDGVPAPTSDLAEHLRQAGFVEDYKGLVLAR